MTTKCKQAIGALCRAIRKWAPRSTFGKLYQATIEPIMCYSIESWYPSQVVLQNSIERVKKYAAKLTLNNFTMDYQKMLKKLNWKPLSRMMIEKRAIIMHHYIHGPRTLPDNSIVLRRLENARYSTRHGHALEVCLPNSSLEAVTSSSLNTAKKLWNALPPEIVAIRHPALFKSAIRRQTTYEGLARNNKQRRIEEML
jgi:hypothetical protein